MSIYWQTQRHGSSLVAHVTHSLVDLLLSGKPCRYQVCQEWHQLSGRGSDSDLRDSCRGGNLVHAGLAGGLGHACYHQ